MQRPQRFLPPSYVSQVRQSSLLVQNGSLSIVQLPDASFLISDKARHAIKELDIAGNPIGVEGVYRLVKGFSMQGHTNLLVLDISRTNTFFHTSSSFVNQLSQMIVKDRLLDGLTQIDLSENLLGDLAATSLLESLYQLKSLIALRLSDD